MYCKNCIAKNTESVLNFFLAYHLCLYIFHVCNVFSNSVYFFKFPLELFLTRPIQGREGD